MNRPTSALLDRLSGLGGARWQLHFRARALAAAGQDIIELTIGEPDLPAPDALGEAVADAISNGRTGYPGGRGDGPILDALSRYYTSRSGHPVSRDQFLCAPGTQAALYVAMLGLCNPGDEVLLADPSYATYEGVIAAANATAVFVPTDPDNGFRMRADDVAQRITERSKVILLNSPHNPTGAVLSAQDVSEIGALARAHGLRIISDEVYEQLTFDAPFASPFDDPAIADRTIAVSSISKSHAAPGFRSGWLAASEALCARLLPLSETMLFGTQPFIMDATAAVLNEPSAQAAEMRRRFSRRSALMIERLEKIDGLLCNRPAAGMFLLANASARGLNGDALADRLLDEAGVAVMPGSSFGPGLTDWVRISLTVDDQQLASACDRIQELFA